MMHFLIRRLLILSLRIGSIAAVLLVLIEIGFGWLREDSIHVWNLAFSAPVSPELSPSGESAVTWVWRAFGNSVPTLLIAMLGIWMIGYGWGILGSRFRSLGASFLLRAPFGIAACFPGFWLVILISLYSYFVWERPGFADEIRVEQGPDLVVWWNASVVALPLILVGSSRLLRAVSSVLTDRAAEAHRGAFFLLGASSEEVFYQQVCRPVRHQLAELLDRVFPLTLGGLVIVETAFHQGGIGFAFVKGIREGSTSVVFLSAFLIACLGAILALVRECLVYWLERRES